MNYKKVIQDFNNGIIDGSKTKLIMAGADGFWVHIDQTKSEAECMAIETRFTRDYGVPSGYLDIVDVLNAAGICADWS